MAFYHLAVNFLFLWVAYYWWRGPSNTIYLSLINSEPVISKLNGWVDLRSSVVILPTAETDTNPPDWQSSMLSRHSPPLAMLSQSDCCLGETAYPDVRLTDTLSSSIKLLSKTSHSPAQGDCLSGRNTPHGPLTPGSSTVTGASQYSATLLSAAWPALGRAPAASFH